MNHQDLEELSACRSCGAALSGRYCSACGEKAFHEHDLSLGHLSHDVVHELTHLDGKIFRTLRALLTKPGLLTSEYWAGRLGMWIRPLRLYIFLSALQYLLVSGTLGAMGVHYSINYKANGEPDMQVGTQFSGFHTHKDFNEDEHKIAVAYGALRWIGIFSFAAINWLLYRKLQPYYGAHVIAGLHYFSAQYVISAATSHFTGIGVQLGIIYLLFALRRLYGQSWGMSFGKALLIFLVSMVSETVVIATIGFVVLRNHH